MISFISSFMRTYVSDSESTKKRSVISKYPINMVSTAKQISAKNERNYSGIPLLQIYGKYV